LFRNPVNEIKHSSGLPCNFACIKKAAKKAKVVGFSRQIWYINELQLNLSGKAEQVQNGKYEI